MSSRLVLTAYGFDPTSISDILATVDLLPVCYYTIFITEIRVGLRNLVRFVPLLMPQIALTGSQFSWSNKRACVT
jgi:hypothetical protein